MLALDIEGKDVRELFLGDKYLVRVKPLTPRSDQYVNFPYNFNTQSRRQVTRIKKIIN